MYTDGVTEATNLKDELFSERRLQNDLSVLREKPIQDVVSGLMEKIEDFSQGAPQADDITMMILKYFGGAQ
jgi:sigma-B regulation protein RsbU (phosphoserine phosphatase)